MRYEDMRHPSVQIEEAEERWKLNQERLHFKEVDEYFAEIKSAKKIKELSDRMQKALEIMERQEKIKAFWKKNRKNHA